MALRGATLLLLVSLGLTGSRGWSSGLDAWLAMRGGVVPNGPTGGGPRATPQSQGYVASEARGMGEPEYEEDYYDEEDEEYDEEEYEEEEYDEEEFNEEGAEGEYVEESYGEAYQEQEPKDGVEEALDMAVALADQLTIALAEKVDNLVAPMLHFGAELRARLKMSLMELDKRLVGYLDFAGTKEARQELVRHCAAAAAEPLLAHVSKLQAQYRSRFEDRFAQVMASSEDFEDRAMGLVRDTLGGMRVASKAALPDEFADIPIDDQTAERLGLEIPASLRTLIEDLLEDLELDLLDIIEKRCATLKSRDGGEVAREIIDDVEKSNEAFRFRRRLKVIGVEALTVVLNMIQFWQNKRAVMRENKRREDCWPRLPTF